MYSTLYMSSIDELYNKQKYTHVISLVQKLKESRAFDRYDIPVQDRIQGYYCRALARQTDPQFYTEVNYFKGIPDKQNEYNFLCGFMHRNESRYNKALECFNKVLARHPGHKSAMREIVTVLRGLEDYDGAYEYARTNYLNDPENLYHIQPYFEILIRKDKCSLSCEEKQHIDDMLASVNRMERTSPSSAHYVILGFHAAFVDHDLEKTIGILKNGAKQFPESSYIVKCMFDCYEHFGVISGMSSELDRLAEFGKTNKSAEIAFKIRQAILDAYNCKPHGIISNYINSIRGLNDDAKARLIRKTSAIVRKQEARTHH